MSSNTPQKPRSRSKGQQKRVKGVATTKANVTLESVPSQRPASLQDATAGNEASIEPTEEFPVCWICAEPVKFWSVSQCNHRTCHVCGLRLRALYKRKDCTFCKVNQPSLIFTISQEELFENYTSDKVPFTDSKLGISFETEEMMEETLILLRFNCPDTSCDYIGGGWNDLKMHVRAMHGRQLCDLCVRNKKVFAHEHTLYTHSMLSVHLPTYARRNVHATTQAAKSKPEVIEGGIHPSCGFCREAFFDDDELYAHSREKHEECFVCKSNEIRHQYFENYQQLERHFGQAHHPCNHHTCLDQKFVVFGSKLDLQAHTIEAHQETMTQKDKRDARRILEGVEFEQAPRPSQRRPGRPPDNGRDNPQAGPSRPNRRDNFGASLTTQASFPSLSGNKPTPAPGNETLVFDSTSELDPAALERHAAFKARLSALTNGSASASAAIKSAVRSYRSSESGARDLLSTVFNVLDQDLDAAASILNQLVDLLDDEEKSQTLLAAWNGFKIEHKKEFPDLTPGGVGSSYSGISSGRVLNIKRSTASRTPLQSTRHILDRVANAAASTSAQPADRFPALSATRTKQQSASQRTTPWVSSSSANPSPSVPQRPFSVPGQQSSDSRNKKATIPPKLSSAQFPSLPAVSSTTSTEARRLVNGSKQLHDSTGIWGKGSGGGSAPVTPADSETEVNPDVTVSKKKKGKEKQTLFTLGTFPT